MKNIAVKLIKMQRALRHVGKDGAIKGSGLSYKFVSIERISEAVNIALCEAELAIVGVQVSTREHSKVSGLVTAHVTVTLCDPASGETASFEGDGQGIDSGDKSASKAQTMARKALWQMAFCVAAGDDAEPSFAHRDAALAVRAACEMATTRYEVAAGWKRHAMLLESAVPELKRKAWGYVLARWRALGGVGTDKQISDDVKAMNVQNTSAVVVASGLPEPDDFDIPDSEPEHDDALVET